MSVQLPANPGTYILILYLSRGTRINVGRLGGLNFRRGWYAYVGSAFGPGGLAARIGRHLRVEKKHRWHIDYLRAAADVRWIWYSTAEVSREHIWAEVLAEEKGLPVLGFGCSDCRCPAHLFFFSRQPKEIRNLLNEDLQSITIKRGPKR